MAIKNFDDYIKMKKKHPYAFIEYDGDDSYENDDEDIDIPSNKESLFEKYKKELDAKSNKE